MILIFTLAQAEGKLKEYPLDGMRFYELISSLVFTLWSGVPPTPSLSECLIRVVACIPHE